MDNKLEAVSREVSAIANDVRAIKKLLTGDPNDKPGVIIRLDRVEQKVRISHWVIMIMVAQALAMLLK